MDLVSGSTADSLCPLINCFSFLCHRFRVFKMGTLSVYVAKKCFLDFNSPSRILTYLSES